MILQVLEYWIILQRSQWLAEEQLRKMQAKRLRSIVKHANEQVPFYRQRYCDAGVDPEDIVDVKSVSKLPIIKKEEFKASPLQERTAFDADINSCIPRSTSGSTGIPLTILEDPHSAAFQTPFSCNFCGRTA